MMLICLMKQMKQFTEVKINNIKEKQIGNKF